MSPVGLIVEIKLIRSLSSTIEFSESISLIESAGCWISHSFVSLSQLLLLPFLQYLRFGMQSHKTLTEQQKVRLKWAML